MVNRVTGPSRAPPPPLPAGPREKCMEYGRTTDRFLPLRPRPGTAAPRGGAASRSGIGAHPPAHLRRPGAGRSVDGRPAWSRLRLAGTTAGVTCLTPGCFI